MDRFPNEYNEICVPAGAREEFLEKEVADLKEELSCKTEMLCAMEAELRKVSEGQVEWINVKDRLPGTRDNVLVYVSDIRKIYMAFYFDGLWRQYATPYIGVNTVTHWMPLPEPPKPKVPTFKDVFLEKFPKASCADVNCCMVFTEQFVHYSCDCNCGDCWNQPYFEEEGEQE